MSGDCPLISKTTIFSRHGFLLYDSWYVGCVRGGTNLVGGYKCFMGRDKYENEDLIAYGWPEDVWYCVCLFHDF